MASEFAQRIRDITTLLMEGTCKGACWYQALLHSEDPGLLKLRPTTIAKLTVELAKAYLAFEVQMQVGFAHDYVGEQLHARGTPSIWKKHGVQEFEESRLQQIFLASNTKLAVLEKDPALKKLDNYVTDDVCTPALDPGRVITAVRTPAFEDYLRLMIISLQNQEPDRKLTFMPRFFHKASCSTVAQYSFRELETSPASFFKTDAPRRRGPRERRGQPERRTERGRDREQQRPGPSNRERERRRKEGYSPERFGVQRRSPSSDSWGIRTIENPQRRTVSPKPHMQVDDGKEVMPATPKSGAMAEHHSDASKGREHAATACCSNEAARMESHSYLLAMEEYKEQMNAKMDQLMKYTEDTRGRVLHEIMQNRAKVAEVLVHVKQNHEKHKEVLDATWYQTKAINTLTDELLTMKQALGIPQQVGQMMSGGGAPNKQQTALGVAEGVKWVNVRPGAPDEQVMHTAGAVMPSSSAIGGVQGPAVMSAVDTPDEEVKKAVSSITPPEYPGQSDWAMESMEQDQCEDPLMMELCNGDKAAAAATEAGVKALNARLNL